MRQANLLLVFASNTYANRDSKHKDDCDQNAGFHAMSPFKFPIYLKSKKESRKINKPMKGDGRFKVFPDLQDRHW